MVAFCRQKLVFRDGVEEDVLAVYLCMHGVLTCKVGFLPAHLNRRAHEYDGLVARVRLSPLAYLSGAKTNEGEEGEQLFSVKN